MKSIKIKSPIFILSLMLFLIVTTAVTIVLKSNWNNIFHINKSATVFTSSDSLYNIAVSNDWSAYGSAWGENIGWLTFSPNTSATVYVADDSLSGYLYGENVGWISLSCRNTDSCTSINYGVSNDAEGHLSGLAYGENIGWIDFGSSTSPYQVKISATGTFSGYAYGEDVGWINFGTSSASTTWTPKSLRSKGSSGRRRIITTNTNALVPEGMGGDTETEIISTSTITTTTTTTTTTNTTTPTTSSEYNFTRDLTIGSTGADVTALQNFLISGGYMSSGYPFGYFGPITKAAVIKYQLAKGITPPAGYFGPKTRRVLAADSGLNTNTTTTTPTTSSEYNFTQDLTIGSTGADVTALQNFLISGGYMASGYPFGYFGPITRAAVIKYQEFYKDKILKPWGLTKGTGFFGELTRNFINNNY